MDDGAMLCRFGAYKLRIHHSRTTPYRSVIRVICEAFVAQMTFWVPWGFLEVFWHFMIVQRPPAGITSRPRMRLVMVLESTVKSR